MASQGLTRMAGSAAIGRAPSFNSRMKQSWRLVNRLFFASLRSRLEKAFQRPMAAELTSGCSIGLSRPMSNVSHWRGMRLVRRKLNSSRKAHRHVIPVQGAGNKVVSHEHDTCQSAAHRPRIHCGACCCFAAFNGASNCRAPNIARSPAMRAGRAGSRNSAVLRIRRVGDLRDGRCAARGRRLAACGFHAARGHLLAAFRENGGGIRGARTRGVGRPVHGALPRAVPVQRVRSPAPQGRQFPDVFETAPRSPISTATASTTSRDRMA